jgi:hypothetical protein
LELKTAFSIEQDRRRKELEEKELIGQKERIENLIANYSNKDDDEEDDDEDLTD